MHWDTGGILLRTVISQVFSDAAIVGAVDVSKKDDIGTDASVGCLVIVFQGNA